MMRIKAGTALAGQQNALDIVGSEHSMHQMRTFDMSVFLKVMSYLRPEEAVLLMVTNHEFYEELRGALFWEHAVMQHFPQEFYRQNKNISVNWFHLFGVLHQAYYKGLSSRARKLFSVVKSGNFEQFQLMEVTRKDLCQADEKSLPLYHYVAVNQNKLFSTFCFEKIIQPFYLNEDGFDVKKKDILMVGATLLHWAVALNQRKSVIQLILNGSDVNAVFFDSNFSPSFNYFFSFLELPSRAITPLHLAARSGFGGLVDLLIKVGANVNGEHTSPSLYCPLPIHFAAENGHVSIVKKLIRAGTVAMAVQGSQSAPYLAAMNGHLGVINVFIALKIDFTNTKSLDVAVCNGHLNVVKALISADVNLSISSGLINKAKKYQHHEVVAYLSIVKLDQLIKNTAGYIDASRMSITLFGSQEKRLAAACALKAVTRGADYAILNEHQEALNQSSLRGLYRNLVKKNN